MADKTDEVAVKAYGDLFRIVARAFYSEETVVVIDYMVANRQGYMSEAELTDQLKIPEKSVAQAMVKMVEHDFVLEEEDYSAEKKIKRKWKLSENIVPTLEARIKYIKQRIDAIKVKAKTPFYKCHNCNFELNAGLFALSNDICPKCSSKNVHRVVEAVNDIAKVLEAVEKIQAKVVDAKKKNFPAAIYGAAYMERLRRIAEKNLENEESNAPSKRRRAVVKVEFTLPDEKSLSELAIEKLKEKYPKHYAVIAVKDTANADDTLLKEYYSKNHTNLELERVDYARKLDEKRQSDSKLSDVEYAKLYQEFRQTKKVF